MEKKKEKKQTEKSAKAEKKILAEAVNRISSRGRIFKGKVIAKFPKRLTIEFQRTLYIPKFERYLKKNTRIHARLPDELAHEIYVGDFIKVQECRPLSKIIHFIVIEKIKGGEK